MNRNESSQQVNQNARINNFMNSSSFNLKNFNNFKIDDFGTYDYIKSKIGCVNKKYEKTFKYLNSLRSIEYLLNSFSDLTFFKSTKLSANQHLALQILPILPEELIDNDDSNIEKVTKYLTDHESFKKEERPIDKVDVFFTNNFGIIENQDA